MSGEIVSDLQIRWFRYRRSGLVRGLSTYPTPEQAASALIGVQAQILSAGALAFWNRSGTGTATYSEFAARLHDTRSLIKLWGQRHTLHIYATADWPLVQAAFAQRQSWWEREAKTKGLPGLAAEYDQAVAQVEALLRERGIMGRRDLRKLSPPLPIPLLSPWGGVFSALVRQGHACHARWNDGEARYAHRSFWLPEFEWVTSSAPAANEELAGRYFHTYGPASVQDFAYWRGESVRNALPWVNALQSKLVPVQTKGGERLLLLAEDLPELTVLPPARSGWNVRLLGRFDPLLLGHRGKDWVVPAAFYDRVWRPAGHIEGIVVDYGQACGTWRYDRVGATKISVRAFPFKVWPERVTKAVQREACRVAQFFALQLTDVIVADP